MFQRIIIVMSEPSGSASYYFVCQQLDIYRQARTHTRTYVHTQTKRNFFKLNDNNSLNPGQKRPEEVVENVDVWGGRRAEEGGGGRRRAALMTFRVCFHHVSRRTAMPSGRPDDG